MSLTASEEVFPIYEPPPVVDVSFSKRIRFHHLGLFIMFGKQLSGTKGLQNNLVLLNQINVFKEKAQVGASLAIAHGEYIISTFLSEATSLCQLSLVTFNQNQITLIQDQLNQHKNHQANINLNSEDNNNNNTNNLQLVPLINIFDGVYMDNLRAISPFVNRFLTSKSCSSFDIDQICEDENSFQEAVKCAKDHYSEEYILFYYDVLCVMDSLLTPPVSKSSFSQTSKNTVTGPIVFSFLYSQEDFKSLFDNLYVRAKASGSMNEDEFLSFDRWSREKISACQELVKKYILKDAEYRITKNVNKDILNAFRKNVRDSFLNNEILEKLIISLTDLRSHLAVAVRTQILPAYYHFERIKKKEYFLNLKRSLDGTLAPVAISPLIAIPVYKLPPNKTPKNSSSEDRQKSLPVTLSPRPQLSQLPTIPTSTGTLTRSISSTSSDLSNRNPVESNASSNGNSETTQGDNSANSLEAETPNIQIDLNLCSVHSEKISSPVDSPSPHIDSYHLNPLRNSLHLNPSSRPRGLDDACIDIPLSAKRMSLSGSNRSRSSSPVKQGDNEDPSSLDNESTPKRSSLNLNRDRASSPIRGFAGEDTTLELRQLLDDKMGFALFYTHLASEYSIENLDFYVRVTGLLSTPLSESSKILKMARKIFFLHVESSANAQVNLSASNAIGIKEEIFREPFNPDAAFFHFKNALSSLLLLMASDSFRRFKLKRSYQIWLRLLSEKRESTRSVNDEISEISPHGPLNPTIQTHVREHRRVYTADMRENGTRPRRASHNRKVRFFSSQEIQRTSYFQRRRVNSTTIMPLASSTSSLEAAQQAFNTPSFAIARKKSILKSPLFETFEDMFERQQLHHEVEERLNKLKSGASLFKISNPLKKDRHKKSSKKNKKTKSFFSTNLFNSNSSYSSNEDTEDENEKGIIESLVNPPNVDNNTNNYNNNNTINANNSSSNSNINSSSNISVTPCKILKFGRWFSVSEDGSELLSQHLDPKTGRPKTGFFATKKRRLLADAVSMVYGTKALSYYTEQALNEADVVPWLVISIAFSKSALGDNCTLLDILCRTEEQVTDWFLGLQSLIPLSRRFLTKGQLYWKRLNMKIKYYSHRKNMSISRFLKSTMEEVTS